MSGDDTVDLGRRHAEALDDLALRERLPELEARAAGDDLAAVVDELLRAVCEVSTCGCPFTMARLLTPKVLCSASSCRAVEHDLGRGVALELDDDAHAVAVARRGVADALDLLLAHELGDASSSSLALLTWYGISVTTIARGRPCPPRSRRARA
jgi:hypothetical protein